MPKGARHVLVCLAILSCSEVFCKSSRGPPAPREWQGSLGQLFSQIDTDGDGQIEASEAARYIGDSSVGAQDLQYMQANVDGADQGDTISETELQRHLQSLMKASSHDFFASGGQAGTLHVPCALPMLKSCI